MKCPQCDFENEEGSIFCNKCNIPLIKQDYSEDNPYIKKNINEDEEEIKKILLKEFGYMGVVDTQISIYNKLKKEMPELSENEILNKLIFSRIQAVPIISSEEEEYTYYKPLLQNSLKDLELVIIYIVNYEFIESRKEEIKKIIPYDYVIKFQMESGRYIQEKVRENEEKYNYNK